MSLLMRDSDDPFAIPLDNLAAVAGYADGLPMWSSAGWARFPSSVVPLSIVLNAADQGDILDVERGAASPADAPGWCDHFNRPRRRAPSIYVNRANWVAVRATVGPRRVDYWVATLDDTLDGTAGSVAVQWKGSALTGGHYDESVVLDVSWLGMTPEEHQMLVDINLRTALIYNANVYAGTGEIPDKRLAQADATGAGIAKIEQMISGLQVPPANLQPVLDAIAALKADLDGLTLKKA